MIKACRVLVCGGAGFDQLIAGFLEHSDGFDRAGAGAGCGGGVAGLDRGCGADRVFGVGFAGPAAFLPVGPVDLHHPDVVLQQVCGDTGAVAAGAFHAHRGHGSEGPQPGQ